MLRDGKTTIPPADGSPAAGKVRAALPNEYSPTAIGLEPQDTQTSNSCKPRRICLSRLDQLAPQVACVLHASWSDPDLTGRLIEGLLGGGWNAMLQTEAVIELVRIYEQLETVRAAHEADETAEPEANVAYRPGPNQSSPT